MNSEKRICASATTTPSPMLRMIASSTCTRSCSSASSLLAFRDCGRRHVPQLRRRRPCTGRRRPAGGTRWRSASGRPSPSSRSGPATAPARRRWICRGSRRSAADPQAGTASARPPAPSGFNGSYLSLSALAAAFTATNRPWTSARITASLMLSNRLRRMAEFHSGRGATSAGCASCRSPRRRAEGDTEVPRVGRLQHVAVRVRSLRPVEQLGVGRLRGVDERHPEPLDDPLGGLAGRPCRLARREADQRQIGTCSGGQVDRRRSGRGGVADRVAQAGH